MKRSSIFIVSCVVILFLLSCKKNILSPVKSTVPSNFSEVFDDFWNKMNTNYLYWDIDTTDWDAMHKRYQPIFSQLNLENKSDIQKSVGYFRQMTDGLTDSHYAISFISHDIIDSFVFPALDRKRKNSNFHSPFLYISVDSNYLDRGFVSGKYITSENAQLLAVCGTIRNKILYFYCNRFALQEAYTSNTANGVKTTLQYFFRQLQNLSSNINGLIVDVRNNSGGDLVDLNFLVGKLTDKPILFGYTHYKSGNGRLAFTPWINSIITPWPGAKELQVPVIVMADNYSVSLAEAVTMAIRALPNSSFVGETTWGATGPITKNIVYNDGQFDVPGFLSVYTSSAAFKYIDGNSYEGKGFPPDIAVPFDLISLLAGRDQQLDKAISLIK